MYRFKLDELESAAKLVYEVVPPTPQYAWPKLRSAPVAGVWVKHENHTPTGAFKVRGGIVYLDNLRRSTPEIPGIVTATRGNHGQSISFAASRAGVPATIFVPRGNSPDQNASMAAFGATVVEFGRDFDEAKHEAHRVAAEKACISCRHSTGTSSPESPVTRLSFSTQSAIWTRSMSESEWAPESAA